jgi:serine/threonine-protein kinase
MWIAPGTRLGQYEIVAALAAGAMGEVYSAIDSRLNRRVALKVLPPAVADDPDRRVRFEREARSASALNHPNIVTIYDVGEEGRVHYIAMEFVEGRTVRTIIQSGPMSPLTAVQIAAQVAAGLAKAHDIGIAHRDLKPENVMVTLDGYVKVLDFGLAKLLLANRQGSISEAPTMAASAETTPGAVMGTVGYMSPEQARGLPTDVRADQFALGAILYEMLTGSKAFPGTSAIDVLAGIVRDSPRAVSTMTSVPPIVDGIVTRCLAKDPAGRYQSTRDLAEQLDAALRELAVPSRTVGGSLSGTGVGAVATMPGGPQPRSIAVLPFADLSPEHDQEYFCDGLADELIADLGTLEGARVASRTAAFQFKGQTLGVTEIGRRLNATTILEGSVRKSGNRLRITVQLISVDDGYQLWSERYNRDLDDIFTIQDEIAKAIVQKLKPHFAHHNPAGALDLRARRRPTDTEAYHEYLRGRFYWNKRTPAAFEQAIHHFRRAVERDPAYGLAQAGLADTFNLLGYYNALSPRDAYPNAKESSSLAIESDPMLCEAYASRGFSLLFYDRDWEGAEASLRKAVDLDPSYASAHQWLAWVLFVRERFEEALASMQRAHALDPLSPVIGCHLAYSLELVGRRKEAVDQLHMTLALTPSFPLAHWHIGQLRLAEGRHEDAIQSFRATVDTSDGRIGLAYLGRAYAVAGRRAEAQEVLERFKSQARCSFTSPLDFALVYAGLGERDAVFAWLDRAYDERVSDLSRLKLLGWPDDVRADPRYAALLERLNLPR